MILEQNIPKPYGDVPLKQVPFAVVRLFVNFLFRCNVKSRWFQGNLLSCFATDTPMPELEERLIKFQNPSEADKLMKIQKDLDETKIILVSMRLKTVFHR